MQIGNTEWPKWETVMAADPVPADVLAEQARAAAADPAAAGPRRPRRHAEVRLRRRAAGARARQRPRDGGPGRPRRRRRARSSTRPRASRLVSHTVAIGPVAVPEGAPLPLPDDVDALDADPRALLRRRDERRGWSPRSTPPPGRRHPRRRRRGARLRPAAGPRAATCTGTAASTPGSPAALMGIQAIKGVEVGDGFRTARPPRLRGPRRDRARRRRRRCAAGPAAPAAPRAA